MKGAGPEPDEVGRGSEENARLEDDVRCEGRDVEGDRLDVTRQSRRLERS